MHPIFLLIAAVQAASDSAAFQPHVPSWKPTITDICASSGLRLVTIEDRRAPVVSVVTVVEGGSADDPPGKEGLAHLAEHLWFRTPLTGSTTVTDTLDRLALHNAFTFPDEVVFVESAAAADLDALLTAEGHRYAAPLSGVSATVFEAERQVVAQELRQNRLDDAGGALAALYARLLPDPHAYARIATDTPESVLRLTLDDARAWADAHFRPERVSIHIAGAVSATDARRAVWRAFPEPALGVPAGTVPRSCGEFGAPTPALPAPSASPDLLVLPGATVHRQAVVAWAIPGGWSGADSNPGSTVELLEAVMRSMVPTTDTAGELSCSEDRMRQAAVVLCAVPVADKADPKRVIEAMLVSLDGFARDDYRAGLGRLWNYATFDRFARVLQRAESVITPLSPGDLEAFRYSHTLGDPAWHTAAWASLGDTSFDRDRALARQWFTRARAVRALIQPAAPASSGGTSTFALAGTTSTVATQASASTAQRALPVDPTRIQAATLDNGLSVVVLPWPGAPLAGVEVVFTGGRSSGPAPGLADLVEASLVWLPTIPGDDLGERIARAGIQTWRLFDAELSGFRWTAPAANVDDMLRLARSRIGDERIETTNGKDLAQLLGEGLEAWMDDPRGQVASLAWDQLFEGNPWVGRPTHARWRAAQTQPLARWKALVMGVRQPANATVIIVGDIPPADAVASVKRWLGSWPLKPAEAPPPAWSAAGPPSADAHITLVDTPSLSTARVAATCRVDGGLLDPRHAPLERWAAGMVSHALRESTGLAYDPWASVVHDPVGGAVFTLGATFAPASVEVGRARMGKVLTELATTTDDEGARQAARVAANSALVQAATTSGALSFLRGAALAPGGIPAIETRADALAQLDAAAIRAVMAPCTIRTEYVVMGPAAAMEAPLAGAGLPITRVDWDAFKRETSGREVR